MMNSTSFLIWLSILPICILPFIVSLINYGHYPNTMNSKTNKTMDSIYLFSRQFAVPRYPGVEPQWTTIHTYIQQYFQYIDTKSSEINTFSYSYHSENITTENDGSFLCSNGVGNYVASIYPNYILPEEDTDIAICLFSHIDSSFNSIGYADDLFGFTESLILLEDFINREDLKYTLHFIYSDITQDHYDSFYSIPFIPELHNCMINIELHGSGCSYIKPSILGIKGKHDILSLFMNSSPFSMKSSNYIFDSSSILEDVTGSTILYDNLLLNIKNNEDKEEKKKNFSLFSFLSSKSMKSPNLIIFGFSDRYTAIHTSLDDQYCISKEALFAKYDSLYYFLDSIIQIPLRTLKPYIYTYSKPSLFTFFNYNYMISSFQIQLCTCCCIVIILFFLLYVIYPYMSFHSFQNISKDYDFLQGIYNGIHLCIYQGGGLFITFIINYIIHRIDPLQNHKGVYSLYVFFLLITSCLITFTILQIEMYYYYALKSIRFYYCSILSYILFHLSIVLIMNYLSLSISFNILIPTVYLSILFFCIYYYNRLFPSSHTSSFYSSFMCCFFYISFLLISFVNLFPFIQVCQTYYSLLVSDSHAVLSLFICTLASYIYITPIFTGIYYFYCLIPSSLFFSSNSITEMKTKDIILFRYIYTENNIPSFFIQTKQHFLYYFKIFNYSLVYILLLCIGIVSLIPTFTDEHPLPLQVSTLFFSDSTNSNMNNDTISYNNNMNNDTISYNNNNSYNNSNKYNNNVHSGLYISDPYIFSVLYYFRPDLLPPILQYNSSQSTQCYISGELSSCIELFLIKNNHTYIPRWNYEYFPLTSYSISKSFSFSFSHISQFLENQYTNNSTIIDNVPLSTTESATNRMMIYILYSLKNKLRYRDLSIPNYSIDTILNIQNYTQDHIQNLWNSFSLLEYTTRTISISIPHRDPSILGEYPYCMIYIHAYTNHLKRSASTISVFFQRNNHVYRAKNTFIKGIFKNFDSTMNLTLYITGKRGTYVLLQIMDISRINTFETYSVMKAFHDLATERLLPFHLAPQAYIVQDDFVL
ncbi:hypothetical protein WA158_001832 [Blastocystis sp. Blastoise]